MFPTTENIIKQWPRTVRYTCGFRSFSQVGSIKCAEMQMLCKAFKSKLRNILIYK